MAYWMWHVVKVYTQYQVPAVSGLLHFSNEGERCASTDITAIMRNCQEPYVQVKKGEKDRIS